MLLIIGLAASAFICAQRYRVESRNRAVEIVLDYDEVRQMAAATGKSPVDIMKHLKEAGATSVAVTEMTFGDAVDNRLIIPYSERRYAIFGENRESVYSHLLMALPSLKSHSQFSNSASSAFGLLTLSSDIPMEYMQQIPIGLPPQATVEAKSAGLEVVARLLNYTGVTADAIDDILRDVKAQGISKVIFSGDQVLGFKSSVEDAAESIKNTGIVYGKIEFSKQKGEEALARKAQDSTIIVHSISGNEMPGMNQASITDRFQKAVRERGVRMCYVRMYDMASKDMLDLNSDYISDIAKGIEKAGYKLSSSHPVGEVVVPRALRGLAGIGVAAGLMLLIGSVVSLSGTAFLIWTVFALLICAGLPVAAGIGQKLIALASAAIFPTLAALYTVRNTPTTPTAAPRALPRAIGRLVCAVLTTAAGGLLIVGLVSQRSFMLRIDQFMGVKLAHLLPVMLLVLIFVGSIAWKRDTWDAQKKRFTESIVNIGRNPVLIWQAVGMAALLVIVALMVARSGNDSGLGVSDTELRFRSILDKVLYVRPRTKEFLIGYPALLWGIAFALRGRRQWAMPLVVLGSIGLVSALNTFCHIHTPIMLSVIRIINGLVVGTIIGCIAYWLLWRLPGREK